MSKRVISNIVILLVLSTIASAKGYSTTSLNLERTDKGIELSTELPEGYTHIEVRIVSDSKRKRVLVSKFRFGSIIHEEKEVQLKPGPVQMTVGITS